MRPQTLYRIYRLADCWVATHEGRRVNPWNPQSIRFCRRKSGGWGAEECGIKGRTPFEALERLKTHLRVRA